MEDAVVIPDVTNSLSYEPTELQTPEAIEQEDAEKAVDIAIGSVVAHAGWNELVKQIEADIAEAGDITQMASYDGNPQFAGSIIGQAKFVSYLKAFKERVENAAQSAGSRD